MVTPEANALMLEIHNIKKRIPVILRKEDENKWLEHFPIKEFAFPYELNLVAKKIDQSQISLF